MGDYLILDTGILVAMERRQLNVSSAFAANDDIVVPAIVVAEYLHGVYRAKTTAQRATRRAFLDLFLAKTPIVDYTGEVADHHARLLAHVSTVGEPRGAHDLIIAATAIATGRILVTTDDKARFDQLPGLTVRVALDTG